MYRVLVGKSEAKIRLVKPRCRWKSIKMDLKETQEIWLAEILSVSRGL